jgi:hypothetical protein
MCDDGRPVPKVIRISHDDLKSGLEGKLAERSRQLIDHDPVLDVNGGLDLTADMARLAAGGRRAQAADRHQLCHQSEGSMGERRRR